MKVDLFDFDLPPQLIAQHPIEPRDASRMLHVGAGGLGDKSIKELVELVGPGDVLVVNDTKVIPARLFGNRGAKNATGKVEATLHKQISPDTWAAFCKPAKRFVVGEKIHWSKDLWSLTLDRRDGEVILHFSCGGADLINELEKIGQMPLPPYIKRDKGSTQKDSKAYQTLFADKEGAVAAPTASLHFTPDLVAAVEAKGAKLAKVTLHVGAGTFLPMKAEDTEDHLMHAEWWQINEDAAKTINAAKRVIAVGTTSLRTLESAAETVPSDSEQRVIAGQGDTRLFVTPGYDFKAVDVLLTNFHLPKSTLFMLVSAFCGLDQMQAAYAHAIAQEYRFFSYGDCCFLERQK
ncbi:MAG: tRNA preQ1(34) S-adenosylmethionine ribosyltransferase-isomerase QueA [Alphaproteobacteria bacterium]